MRYVLILLLASCAFGQSEYSAIVEWSKMVRDKNYQQDSLLADLDKRLKALENPTVSVMRILMGTTGAPSCEIQYDNLNCPPHSWAWGDTSYWKSKKLGDIYVYSESGYKCPGICRNCLADTLVVWSYAEDEQRRKAAKKLSEYEILKERKRESR